MDNSTNYRNFFMVMAVLIIGTVSITNIGKIDAHSVITTGWILIPAIVVFGILGHKIGEIVDNPKNRADADYKIAVLNALKKMDKSISLQELNEKLTKAAAEPDTPDIENDDLDV